MELIYKTSTIKVELYNNKSAKTTSGTGNKQFL